MPLHITNLPSELLLEITRGVISKEDLCQLRSVNSLFETLATPEIFKSITVRNNKQSADKFWTLLHTPRIASHIQSISFVEEYTLAEKEVRKRLEVAFSVLHQAPGLKTLELYFCLFNKGPHGYVAYYSHQWDIVKALGGNRNPLPALQSLKIHGWLCCEDELMLVFDEAPIAWLAASLRHLSFTVPGISLTDELELLERFWKQVVVQRVLQPAVNLESLVITGSGNSQYPDAQCFGASQLQLANLPRLAALSLRHIVWEDDASGQGDMVPLEFVVRHQMTLKRLELHNCAIRVRNRYMPPHCCWADIYKRLANALTGLVELKVEVKLKYNVPYVYFIGHPSYEFLKKDDLKERAWDAALAQDALALEEFRAVVKSQGMGGCSRFGP